MWSEEPVRLRRLRPPPRWSSSGQIVPPPLVRGLLHHREARARGAYRFHGAHGAGELAPACRPRPRRPERPHHGAGERPPGAAAFGGDDVGRAVADDLVAGAAMDQQRDPRCTCCRRGGRTAASLPQQSRDAGAERVGGGVLAALLVADLGLRHGLAHGRRRPRHRVAPEIDVIARHAAFPSI